MGALVLVRYYTYYDLIITWAKYCLPSPAHLFPDFLVSVAFISVIRSVAELCRIGQLDYNISLTMLHCERTLDFPFKDELLALAGEFAKDEDKRFDFLGIVHYRRC